MTDDEAKAEILSYFLPFKARELTLRRWETIFRWYHEGRSFEEMAKHYDRSRCTIKQLLKRAFIQRQKEGFAWPVDEFGRKVCDIVHPMPMGENPHNWCHPRARGWHCPVCRKGGLVRTASAAFLAKHPVSKERDRILNLSL